MARGDFLMNRGTVYIDSNGDLVPANVGGQIVAVPFATLDLVTSMAASVIPIVGGNTTNAEFLVPRGGSIIGCAIRLSTAAGTGTVDVWPTINGTTQAELLCHLNAATAAITRTDSASTAKDTLALVAFDRVGLKLTSSADLAPASIDFMATVYIEI